MIYIIECAQFKVINSIKLNSTCFKICTQGAYDIDSRIFCACRDNNIYVIKNGLLSNIKIECEIFIVDMCLNDRNLFVAQMNKSILI